MDPGSISRRRMLLTAAAVPLLTARPSEGGEDDAAAGPRTAEEARERLEAGNRRFAAGTVRHAHEAADWRKHLVAGQQPIATILACSDSRVPPELVFDQGFGDLFVIRVAGNIIADDVVGSLQYALLHLGTPIVVVMGHEECGAVTATLAALDGKAEEPRFIASLVRHITPGLAGLDPGLRGEGRLNAAVEANVLWSIRQLASIPECRATIEEKRMALVGGVYELRTGRVRFLDP